MWNSNYNVTEKYIWPEIRERFLKRFKMTKHAMLARKRLHKIIMVEEIEIGEFIEIKDILIDYTS